MRKLAEVYWERMQEEYLSLEEFLDRARAGEFGDYAPEDFVRFLREVEANILHNIDLKLEEAPHLAPMRDDKIEETHDMIAALIEKYGKR